MASRAYSGWMVIAMAPASPTIPLAGSPIEVSQRPRKETGMVTSSPPIGPAEPMMTSDLRSGMGSLIEMNAPKVPSGGMDGMKKGRDASTPHRFAAR